MKAQRLLATLLLLQSKGKLSARELAAELEVSERTVYRDVDALSAAGVPVFAERGSNGGIVLSDGYRRALTQLGEEDLRSLLVVGTDPLADLGFVDRRRAVVEKLLGALPPNVRRAAEQTRERVLVDQRRWYQSAQPAEFLAAIREAVFSDTRVRLRYRDREGKVSERVVDPLALVSKAGVWYAVARQSDGMRTFRVQRIVALDVLNERFERPGDFSLDAYWQESTRDVERETSSYWLTLRLPPQRMEEIAYWEHEIVDQTQGVVRVNFATSGSAAWQLFAWRDDAEVLEPQEFIDSMVDRARRLLERYAPSP